MLNRIFKTNYLDLGFHIFDGIAWLNLQGDGLSSESLHENLHGVASIGSEFYKKNLIYILSSIGKPEIYTASISLFIYHRNIVTARDID